MPQLLPERKKPPAPDKGDISLPNMFAPLGGGLAAAAVFAVLTKGTLAGLLLAHLAPLPLMIVALGFGLRQGATAALIAAGLLSIWPNPAFGLVYAGILAIPAILACYIALGAPFRGRELVAGNRAAIAVLGASVALAVAFSVAVIAASIYFGSFEEAINPLRAKAFLIIEDMFRGQDLGDRFDAARLSGVAAFAFPATIAGYALLIYSLNLWCAGKLVKASGLLSASWPDIAAEFTLPRPVAAVFVVAATLAAVGDLPGEIALIVAETLGLALALQGLAVAHMLLRTAKIGTVALLVAYFTIGLFGWPILLFTAVGVADAAFSFRARKRAAAQERRG
ncbi:MULTISPECIES: DUF2232 domain-containing protein [Methylosinus]|uniref:DUF2232 domain-containing protein n=2 Tax=Methylosinus trichosporium TaxID=426 RepID=A0A2D2CVS6_METT3|nr:MULTISPECIES: DUF2232 domain-containing protein [Methylosinus]ATQ66805.1 DUF2232 domain-containing protein [Methylosinus trichosporium OB3b]OBS54178.1 hypothetical protein A8B73_01855 [Methylosinus sp. 3S-1]